MKTPLSCPTLFGFGPALFGLSLVLCARASAAPADAPPRSHPANAIKVEVYRNLILIPVQLENGTTCTFLLDSGAATSIVDTRVAEGLNISIHGPIKMRGVGGEVDGRQIRPQVLQVGDLRIERPVMVSLPIATVSSGLGRRIDGLLGWDILRRQVVEIDYAAGQVTFHDAGEITPPTGAEAVPLSDEGTPLVRAHLLFINHDPSGGLFQLDTGFSSTIRLNREFTDRNKLLEAVAPTIEDQALGTGGVETVKRGRAVGMQVGRFVISHPVVSFYRDKKSAPGGDRSIGNLGGEFLHRFHVTLDGPRGRLWLEPTSGLNAMEEIDMTGLRLVATGDALEKILVNRVLAGSPAAKAGLREGDELVRINGQGAGGLGLGGIAVLGREHGTDLQIEYRRKGQTGTVTLKLIRQI